MIVHDGVSTQVDGKYRTHQLDTIHNPLAAVFEVKAGNWIGPTKEGTPDTSGDAVVVRRVLD